MLLELHREWEETGFMDHCFHVDCTALPNFNIFMALVVIHTGLDGSETTCNSKAKITPEKIADLSAIDELLDRLRHKRVVLILDALDEHYPVKVNFLPFYSPKSFDDQKAAYNRSTADSFFVACRALPNLFTVVVGRQGQTWLQQTFPKLRASTFELAGLDLPSAIDYSEMILVKRLIPRSRTGVEADALVHIINLLQRLPLALEIFLSSPFKETRLYDIYQDLIDGRGLAVTISARSQYYINGTARFLRSLPRIYNDKNQEIFYLCLASFWRRGPHDGVAFYSTSGSGDPYTDVGSIFALRKLDAAGVIEMKGKCVLWIHPLWTLYIRSKLHDSSHAGDPFECVAWHEPSLRARFMYDVSDGLLEILKPVVEHLPQNESEFSTVKTVIRESFPNFLTCLQFCISSYPTMPLTTWPLGLLLVYSNHSRFSLSISEQVLLAEGLEKLLERFFELNGGLAVSEENGLHLFAITLCGLLCSMLRRTIDPNRKRARKVADFGIEFHEVSVSIYGQPSPEILPRLLGLYAPKVVDFLENGNIREVDIWREKALELKNKFVEVTRADRALSVQGKVNTSEYAHLIESMDLPWSLFTISMEGNEGWEGFHQLSLRDENELFAYLSNREGRFEKSLHADDISGSGDSLEACIRGWFLKTRSKSSAINHLEEAIDVGAWSQAMKMHLNLFNDSTNQGDHMQALVHAERALSIGKHNLPMSVRDRTNIGLIQEILEVFGDESIYKSTWKATIESMRNRSFPLLQQLGEDEKWRPLAEAIGYILERKDTSGRELDRIIDQCRPLLGDEGAKNFRGKAQALWKYADELEAEEAAERVAEDAARAEEEARQQREAEQTQVLIQEHMENQVLPMVRSAGRNDIADVMKRYIDISQRLTEVDDAEIKDLLLDAAKVFPPHVVSLWRLTLSASRAITLSVQALQLLED